MGYLRASKYFSVPRGTLEGYVKDTSRSAEELENVHVRRNVVPSELENKLVEFCITMDQRYYGLVRQDKMCGFSFGNKKWFETSI